MKFFAETFIKPYVAEKNYSDLCEIGASLGQNTDKLLEVDGVEMTLIDPCVDAQLPQKYEGNPRVRILKGLSLEVLPTLSRAFDCILIDGDHNWYTVYNELRIIREKGLLKEGGTLFFHDVDWPYGRRDMYYEPERVPEEHRQPNARKGILYGKSPLSDVSGANAHLHNATHEGGSRNGVLAAIEEFLRENRNDYEFFRVRQQHGLGVMLRKSGAGGGDGVFRKYRRKAGLISLAEAAKDFLKPSRKRTSG